MACFVTEDKDLEIWHLLSFTIIEKDDFWHQIKKHDSCWFAYQPLRIIWFKTGRNIFLINQLFLNTGNMHI